MMISSGESTKAALAGVRVLDFTNLLAGPFPSLLLGFLGAEVIKVESNTRLDAARRPPYSFQIDGQTADGGGADSSPVFNSVNLNKFSLQLNLKEPDCLWKLALAARPPIWPGYNTFSSDLRVSTASRVSLYRCTII